MYYNVNIPYLMRGIISYVLGIVLHIAEKALCHSANLHVQAKFRYRTLQYNR